MIIVGYAMDHDDVIGISRLRGKTLEELVIPECCILEVIDSQFGRTYTNIGIAEEAVLEEVGKIIVSLGLLYVNIFTIFFFLLYHIN